MEEQAEAKDEARSVRVRRKVITMGAAAVVLASCLAIAPGTAAAAPPGISGTVVGAEGGGIDGALVAVLRTTDFTTVGTTVADVDGDYEVGGIVAGSYYVYALDPDGEHAPGFFGPPTAVAISSGFADADPTLAPTRGSIEGQVTSDAGGPVPGAWVLALGTQDGRPIAGTVAAGDGGFVLDGMAATAHLLLTLDPTGAHAPEYFDDGSIAQADAVTVPAGGSVEVSPALAPTTPAEPTATLSGTITDEISGDPVGGAWAVALDATTFQVEAGAVADGDGDWTMPVDSGGHRLVFIDPYGSHAAEWYPDLANHLLAQSVPVVVEDEGSAVADESIPPNTGSVAGTITEDGSGDPVEGALALVIGGGAPRIAVADDEGDFRIDDVPVGSRGATFVGPAGAHVQEYWDGRPDAGTATTFQVAPGATTTLEPSLAVVPCPATVPAPPVRCRVDHPTPVPGPAWTTYTIQPGDHSSTPSGSSLSFTGVAALRYQFAFDGSARYVLTNPTQPEDQLDWNKLPGLSDCGDLDLAQNGWMFAWRWRTDLTPRVLELNAYANNDGTHLWLPEPMVTLTSEQLDAQLPLWFDLRISSDLSRYEFTIRGPGSRLGTGTLPRACTTPASASWQWTAGFYFGGTSTAPSTITGLMRSLPA